MGSTASHCHSCKPGREGREPDEDAGVDCTDADEGLGSHPGPKDVGLIKGQLGGLSVVSTRTRLSNEEEEFTDGVGRVGTGHEHSAEEEEVSSASGVDELSSDLNEDPDSPRRMAHPPLAKSSKTVLAETLDFIRQDSRQSDDCKEVRQDAKKPTQELECARHAFRYRRRRIKVSETMGITPSAALQMIIYNAGEIKAFYNMQGKLGEGAFGVVRLAHVKSTKAERAVKSIPKGPMKEKMAALKLEIEIMKKVDHPHIVMLYEIFEDAKDLHLVMGICHGGHLEEYVFKNGRLNESMAVVCMQHLFKAVFYLHRNFICHRDLKSGNLLKLHEGPITGTNHNMIKVADFGLSCTFRPRQVLTQFVGTKSHMAPEVVNRRYNQAVDLWSCGVIAYFLLSSTMPFDEEAEGAKRFKYSFGGAWASVSQDAASIVTELLNKSVRKRPNAQQALANKWIKDNCPKPPAVTLTPEVLQRLQNYRSQNLFKRATLSVAASLLSEAEAEPSHKLFQALDVTGDGLISVEELTELAGQQVAEASFSDEYERVGQVREFTYMEFIAATFSRKRCLTKAVCKTAFSAFDPNGDGTISLSELASGRLLGHLTGKELKGVLDDLDKNGDQMIDFKEFTSWMRE